MAARLRWQWRQPGLRALLAEIVGGIRLDKRWIYVTDGGHYENLGLVEALRRGATEIVILDASGDPPDSWSTFGEAMQTARTDLGVEIQLDPSTMRAPMDSSGFAPTLAVGGTFRYPNGFPGTVYLCKLAMPADVSWDVRAWGVRTRTSRTTRPRSSCTATTSSRPTAASATWPPRWP